MWVSAGFNSLDDFVDSLAIVPCNILFSFLVKAAVEGAGDVMPGCKSSFTTNRCGSECVFGARERPLMDIRGRL